MVDLPSKKVGIVACSGEELPEGTVTRLAALKVLEQMRPGDTVTICLPLFLAGGEGDRAFAKFYPTIAVDGCELMCAARATEKYSGKPAASIVVTNLVNELGIDKPKGLRNLDQVGLEAVEATAEHIADLVDEILGKRWSRHDGVFIEADTISQSPEETEATCSCGSNIPIKTLQINGDKVTLVALPLIFEQFLDIKKLPSDKTRSELLDTVKIYNPVPLDAEEAYADAILLEYSAYLAQKESVT